MNSFCFFMLLHTTETPNGTFSRFCTRQKHQMKLFRASARDRKTKKKIFTLLHTAETQLDEKSMRWLELAEQAS